MRVLLTGGAGYIGSHTAIALLEAGHNILVVDNLANSSRESLRRVETITGREIDFAEVDLTDVEASRASIEGYEFDAVIHFAGLKAVGESVLDSTRYYNVNINTLLTVFSIMREREVHRLIFSSSASVYGNQTERISELMPSGVGVTSPYGRSKAMAEQIIRDAVIGWPELTAINLRYFNPIGAHPSGCIGEDPRGIPNNLLPYVSQVAVGRQKELRVFGRDYPTSDGTGVRDYIHVMDLAEGHVAALGVAEPGSYNVNLGTGVGSSVLEVVRAFETVSARSIPIRFEPRRPGDVASLVADPALASTMLAWKAQRSLLDACEDTWRWQDANPRGYVDID